jgi:hypothetical protein
MGKGARLVGFGLGALMLGLTATAGAQVPAQDDVDDNYYAQPQAQPQPAYDSNYAQPQPQPQYGFVGAHPIPYDRGSGICMAQGAHLHDYPPFDQYLFRESGGYFYFVGDLSDFGYSAQTWTYQGNHPIPAGYGGGYCYIDWNHRHHYAPPVGMPFNYVGGVYVYAGGWDPTYWTYRNNYVSYYGGYYRNNYWGGRYWTVRPHHVYRPSLVIGAPGVHVSPGWGGVRVGVGVAPPPRVYAPGPGVYAPPPRVVAPPPRVVAPAPAVIAPRPAVGVGVRGGGGVYIAPPMRR